MNVAVFKPDSGPLLVRGAISEGVDAITKYVRGTHGSRPTSQGGYRFGQLSHNAFFTRNNPHPNRVRHIRGLLDVPICVVTDAGYVAKSTYIPPQFPPNSDESATLLSRGRYGDVSRGGRFDKDRCIPVSARRLVQCLRPIPGIQHYGNKPTNIRMFKEKAIPTIGMVPITEAWREELTALTRAVGLAPANIPPIKQSAEKSRPCTSVYSAETGRLIPPKSRAMTRSGTRGGTALAGLFNKSLQYISEDPCQENVVLQMLCQILQTDDVYAVQNWLVSAGDREKVLVLDMIKSVLTNINSQMNEVNNEQRQQEAVLPDINLSGTMIGDCDKSDRLTLDGEDDRLLSAKSNLKPIVELAEVSQ